MQIYYPKCVCTAKAILSDYGFEIKQPKEFNFEPVSANVEINSYSEADTFSVNARFEDIPFDPRLIRSMSITVSIFDQRKLPINPVRDKNIIIKQAMIIGFVDTHSIALDSSGRIVSFSGRDYTSIFIETKFDNADISDQESKKRRKISLNRPLTDILQDLLKNVPGSGDIQIEDRTSGSVQNFNLAAGSSYSLVNGATSQQGNVEYVRPNETYWDVITSLCEAAGVICYIELDRLVITNPRILFQKEGFTSKKTIPFIYGTNIENLEFHKNLGRRKRFNLILRSLNTRTSETTSVSIPKDATQAWATQTNIEKAVQKVSSLDDRGNQITKPAPSFLFRFTNRTKEDLIKIGEKIFEEFVRQQIEGKLTTREMRVTDSDGVEFDLTQLKTGIPVQVEIVQEDIQYITRKSQDGSDISNAKRLAYLIRRGYERRTAEALIDAVSKTSGKLRPTFYLRTASFNMTSSGFSLDIGFVNFVVLADRSLGKIYNA